MPYDIHCCQWTPKSLGQLSPRVSKIMAIYCRATLSRCPLPIAPTPPPPSSNRLKLSLKHVRIELTHLASLLFPHPIFTPERLIPTAERGCNFNDSQRFWSPHEKKRHSPFVAALDMARLWTAMIWGGIHAADSDSRLFDRIGVIFLSTIRRLADKVRLGEKNHYYYAFHPPGFTDKQHPHG